MRRYVSGFFVALLLGLASIAGAQLITGGVGIPSGGAIGGSCTTTNALLKRAGDQTIGCSAVIDATGALSGITTASMSGQLTSTLATGSAPFVVASTTQVSNLYASRAALADVASAAAFSAITAGTNAAALVVGTGGSLTVSGSGTIAATTAAALATDPADCAAGTVALGINAAGTAQCTATPSVTSIQGIVGNVTPLAGTFTTGTFSTSATSPVFTASAVGSAAAVAYSVGGANNGMYALSATTVGFSANGTRVFYVDSSSVNVGPNVNFATTTDGNGAIGQSGSRFSEIYLGGKANVVPLNVTGYSVTGSGTSGLASYTGTLNTSGVAHVNDWSITNTASGAGSTLFRIRAGAAGATDVLRVTTPGQVLVEALKTTGAATGKKIVCVDLTTGQLYASSSDVQCLN